MNLKITLPFILLLSTPVFADDVSDIIGNLADDCQRGIEKLAEAGKTKSCSRHQAADPYPTTMMEGSNGEMIEISVVPKEKLKSIHYFVTTLGTPLRHRRLCSQRAHIMSYELAEQKGIKTGKLMTKPGKSMLVLPGQIEVNYTDGRRYYLDYHVASFVAVEENGKMEQYVIDPFISTVAIPRAEWEGRQKNVGGTYVTNRFALDLRDTDTKNLNSYEGIRSIQHTWQVIEQERGKK